MVNRAIISRNQERRCHLVEGPRSADILAHSTLTSANRSLGLHRRVCRPSPHLPSVLLLADAAGGGGEMGYDAEVRCAQVCRAAFVMVMAHYIKREIETFFVHRFSNATMPFYRIFINPAHYWILCAAAIGYSVYRPAYHSPNYPAPIAYLCIFGFIVGEIMNGCCHLVLRNLRYTAKARGIPKALVLINSLRASDSASSPARTTSGKWWRGHRLQSSFSA